MSATVLLAGTSILLWIAWVAQAALSAKAARHVAAKLARPEPREDRRYRPPVTLVMPLKGLDDDPERVVAAVARQDHPGLRAIFVVESEEDAAHDALARSLERRPELDATLLIAGPSGPGQGQKVHNQLRALELARSRARGGEVLVFADADAVPDPAWLGRLVGPLHRSRIVVTTGYRWLVPEPLTGARRATLWSDLACVMNASVACLLANRRTTRAWGGSMAVTVEDAQRGDLGARWRGAITDDFPLSELARALGGAVRFVPHCLVATPISWQFAELANFAHRQYLITRVYAPRLFLIALTSTWLYTIASLSAWTHLLAYALKGSGAWWWPVPAIAAVAVLNRLRANARRRIVRLAFSEDLQRRLQRALWLDQWATLLWMALHAVLVLRAAFGRTMLWRGIHYRLHGPQRIERLDAGT